MCHFYSIFTARKWFFQDLGSNQVIESGLKEDGLYRLHVVEQKVNVADKDFQKSDLSPTFDHICNNVAQIKHLHARLSHTSMSKMSKLDFVYVKNL